MIITSVAPLSSCPSSPCFRSESVAARFSSSAPHCVLGYIKRSTKTLKPEKVGGGWAAGGRWHARACTNFEALRAQRATR